MAVEVGIIQDKIRKSVTVEIACELDFARKIGRISSGNVYGVVLA